MSKKKKDSEGETLQALRHALPNAFPVRKPRVFSFGAKAPDPALVGKSPLELQLARRVKHVEHHLRVLAAAGRADQCQWCKAGVPLIGGRLHVVVPAGKDERSDECLEIVCSTPNLSAALAKLSELEKEEGR